MSQPLEKPEHLRAEPSWLAARAAGAIALGLGLVAFIVVAVSQEHFWATPDWRISVPGFVATAIASTASLVRRERAYELWPLGLGLAAAGLVLGWFLMIAVVIGVTALVIAILHHTM